MKSERNQHVASFEAILLRSVKRLGLDKRAGLLAVSGGADSCALLLGFSELGVPAEVATVDHGLRNDSSSDTEWVRQLCGRLGMPVHVCRVELGPGPGVEARAREARYTALQDVKARCALGWVATGHTASDQAETVLMRLARGASLKGAAGLLEERSDGVVRPLLFARREETAAYCAAKGVRPLADPMNEDPSFARVRVRQAVLPALVEAMGPGVERALARFARLARDDDAELQARAAEALAAARDGDGVRLAPLSGLSVALRRRVVALLLEGHGLPVDADTVEDCVDAMAGGRTATLPLDRLLVVGNDRAVIRPAPPRR